MPLLRRPSPAVVPFDCHCHLLTGLDDGARDLQESVAMARALFAMGIREVFATPHVSSDEHRNERAEIVQRVRDLEGALAPAGIALAVLPGAEYLAEPALLERAGREQLLCFGERRCVLVELPQQLRLGAAVRSLLERLQQAGYTPIIAHAERCAAFQKQPELAVGLREQGVGLQVNYGSFDRRAAASSRRLAGWLYDAAHVDFFGTDLHRPPVGGEP
jgi:protein-tyrosine phosphatase